LHRREREQSRQSAAEVNEKWDKGRQPTWRRLVGFVGRWLKASWKDLLAMAILGAASQAIYSAPLASVRNFPITFNQSGDIVYPEFAYPERGWILTPLVSGLLAALVPIGIIVIAQIRIRSFWDANNAILGVLYAIILGTLFQVIMKMLVGGFRPYFLEVCQPDISRAAGNNVTMLNAVGFQQIMYSVDICTNPSKSALKNAMTSFPSGHATAAFAGYVFLFLWMNAKMKVWANYQTSFYWLALLMVPLLAAVLMACALSITQDHHWYDILAGCTIGTIMAFASYRTCYAAVWDWRYNHIPLTRRDALDYAAGLTPPFLERAVFIRKAGWGRRRRPGSTMSRRGLKDKEHRGSWNGDNVSNGGAVTPPRTSLRHPEPVVGRGSTSRGRGVVTGDNMV